MPEEEYGNPHLGGLINVYVSPDSREACLHNQGEALAVGTVIVKEKLLGQEKKEESELGVMIKREKGFAPKSGDWQYIFVDSQGTVTDDQAKLANCASCHRLRAKTDYVFRQVELVKDKSDAATPPVANAK